MNLKFCIQNGESSVEKLAIINGCHKLGYNYTFSKNLLKDHIPIGTVDYCDPKLGSKNLARDFYPDFLRGYLYREIKLIDNNFIRDKTYFIKEATNWKSDFIPRLIEPKETLPLGLYYISDPVNFYMEFRLYVAAGHLIGASSYIGEDNIPDLKIDWPKDFSGAVDFGFAHRFNEPLLIESHPPFACGLYDISDEDYTFWQYEGWINYIKNYNK